MNERKKKQLEKQNETAYWIDYVFYLVLMQRHRHTLIPMNFIKMSGCFCYCGSDYYRRIQTVHISRSERPFKAINGWSFQIESLHRSLNLTLKITKKWQTYALIHLIILPTKNDEPTEMTWAWHLVRADLTDGYCLSLRTFKTSLSLHFNE